jgi:hypothetical protein
MRIASIVSMSVLVVAMFGAGCAKDSVALSTFNPDQPLPPTATANEPGEYQLFAADVPHPIFTITMPRRAHFGFRSSGGQVVAFAQRLNTSTGKPLLEDVEKPLPGGDRTTYYWKMAPTRK